MQNKNYDIILSGSGMAGLSLVYRALKEGIWKNETILIIDKSRKEKNDRTWCFWQQEAEVSDFEQVIFRRWEKISYFTNSGLHLKLQNGAYLYNMIRSIDFYEHVLNFICQFKNISFLHEEIISIDGGEKFGIVKTTSGNYTARYIFNSVYKKPELKSHNQYFLQHFKGLRIRTTQFKADPGEMYLMDFRTSQQQGATFFYVLPLDKNEIFLEYTIFSKSLLEPEEYDLKIKEYLTEVLEINEYEILESEFGIIPMTDYNFERRAENVINIGVAGGDTRGSSGYTFTNTQKTISKILDSFKNDGHPYFKDETISTKHKLLDATILKVLDENVYNGEEIFSDLFKNVKAESVFAFLDSESSIIQDLTVMRSLKAKHFIGPFIQVIHQKILGR
ncbi:lycopene cyclase family protein [Dyadobacter psychrotolerans]|uniref:Lycopene cyclase n=1 Tax=Dyadobacter psychrotolerans TaxID=2541721 RepID=A0A4R5DRW9_9BACT|nr:lycopene cyclase family protein [Dyadobacter psychrotolerans]TDE17172.1 lycopene cyclase [Dyadobacter psychrotolerans]